MFAFIMNKKIIRIFFWSIFLLSFFSIGKAVFLPSYPDFQTYYNTTRGFLMGKNLYTISSPFSSTFVYPPFALLGMLPFNLFPLSIAGNIWSIFSFFAFIVSIFLLLTIEHEKLFSNRFLFFYTIAFLSFPAKFTLGMGQINMFVLLCISAFLYLYKKKNFAKADGILALSIATKFFPLFFLLLFIIKKQWKNIAYVIGFIFAFWAISVVIFSPSIFIYYWRIIFPVVTHAVRTDYYNQALSGFVFRIFGIGQIGHIFLIVLTLIILSISILIAWKNRTDSFYIFTGFFITVQLLTNTFSEQHYFVWLLIPYIQITYLLLKRKSKALAFLPIVISFMLTQSNMKNPQMVPAIFQPHVFYGTLILWGYILYIMQYGKYSIFD